MYKFTVAYVVALSHKKKVEKKIMQQATYDLQLNITWHHLTTTQNFSLMLHGIQRRVAFKSWLVVCRLLLSRKLFKFYWHPTIKDLANRKTLQTVLGDIIAQQRHVMGKQSSMWGIGGMCGKINSSECYFFFFFFHRKQCH